MMATAVSKWIDTGDHLASTINAWTIQHAKIAELEVTGKRRAIYFRHERPDQTGALQFVVDPYVTRIAPAGMTFGVRHGRALEVLQFAAQLQLKSCCRRRAVSRRRHTLTRTLGRRPRG